MDAPLLQLKNVRKYFPVKKVRGGEDIVVKAVDSIDLTVNSGEIVGLVGESGCGKSTLGKSILKLYDITEGQILFHGEDITKYSEKQMHPPSGEDPDYFPGSLCVAEPEKENRSVCHGTA